MGATVSSTHASHEDEQSSGATRAIKALNELQSTLHQLTPAEQWEVKRALPFASTEWQEGLALSMKPVSTGFGESVHGQSNFASLSSGTKETEVQKRIRLTPDAGKVILVLVGIPARGKSMYGHKLENFLSWRGFKTKSFKVGSWRRGERQATNASDIVTKSGEVGKSPTIGRRGLIGLAAQTDEEPGESKHTEKKEERAKNSAASFFDASKAYAAATREQVTMDCFSELLQWLENDNGQVAIFDACNVTIARRAKLAEMTNKHMRKYVNSPPISTIYIESVVTDAELLQHSMMLKCRLSNDFKGMPIESAMADLADRISHYEKTYETVREAEGAYIKIFDMRAKLHVCNVYGRMAKSVLPFVMATHAVDRPVYLLPIEEGRGSSTVVGGVAAAAAALPPDAVSQWIAAYPRRSELHVITSPRPRALALAQAVVAAAGAAPPLQRAQLAVGAGDDTSTQEGGEASSFHRLFGESVADLVVRLEPIVLEIEGSVCPILIVADEATCRVLRAFLLPEVAKKSMDDRESVDSEVAVQPGVLLQYAASFEGGPMVETVTGS